MTLNWETFKSALGSYWNTSGIVYVDEEGSEIPIGSDCEFQEALRLAKLNKNRLKLILYDKNIPSSQKMYMTFPESVRIFTPVENIVESHKVPNILCNPNGKENACGCVGDIPPEWFVQYMEKFKKDLIHELKSNILETIKSNGEKDQKPPHSKSDSVDLLEEKNETLFSPVTTHTKKEKVSDKILVMDLPKQRDINVSKKLEKLHPLKSERLEKQENKTKLLVLERDKLSEKKRHSKSKLYKNCLSATERKNGSENSASFNVNEIYLFVVPGGKFTVTVTMENNGKLPWTSPQLECYDENGLYPDEVCISLPRLLPSKSCFVTLRGRASRELGLHHFKCRIVDEMENIGGNFICWARVDYLKPVEKYSHVVVGPKESDVSVVEPVKSIKKLIDFEKDVIASSEKKIEENIMEIEKRLQLIDLLRPSTSAETNLKKTPVKTKKILPKTSEIESCDLLQTLEEKEKISTKRLEQEKVLFGVDCLRLASEGNEVKINPRTDENQQVESLEKIIKDCELDSSSDSELSVIFMSEEEENFIVVPLPSKSPSPAESVHEDKKSVNVDLEEKPAVSQERSEKFVAKKRPSKASVIDIQTHVESVHEGKRSVNVDSKEKQTASQERLKVYVAKEKPSRTAAVEILTHVDKEASSSDSLSPTRNRRSSFVGEIPKSRSKKMKSKSTEYRFTTANLTQPTFTAIPDGLYSERPSKFTFTGEKKNSSDNVFEFTFTGEKDEKTQKDEVKRNSVPKTDASGRVIYAVNQLGRCLPVGEIFENGEHSKNSKEENSEKEDQGNQNQHEKRNDRFNEIPSVNILPNVLMSGASNVASMAFNTAKTVINNLQSAFVTEGKTELGKPAWEDKKKVSMENMFKLYQMGFTDLQINRKLLLIHDNDLSKVIEELVRLNKNSSDQPE